MEAIEHEAIVVRRPHGQVRPICSCGWLGTTCKNLADAKLEALEHEAQYDVLFAILLEIEQRS